MNSRPLVFFGSSKYFSAPVLEKVLTEKCSVTAVVTTPDRPIGRHLKLTPNPVKLLALQHQIPVFYSPKDELTKQLTADSVGLVAAYGKILPQSVLDAFGGHVYTIHPSLLPKYRGPSPLQQQILDGVAQTGVTILRLDAQMDHGPIVAQATDTTSPNDAIASLGERLFAKGAKLFLDNLESLINNPGKPQNEADATYTHKITRQDGFVPWPEFKTALDTSPSTLDAKFRAFYPWPGVWTTTPHGQRLKLISLKPEVVVQPESRFPLPWGKFPGDIP